LAKNLVPLIVENVNVSPGHKRMIRRGEAIEQIASSVDV
jgi:hypothetical protein